MKNIKALGEIALRVNDIPGMTAFYEDVVGLEVMRREENMTFFRIAEGYAGHTQILAFFDRSSADDYIGIDSAKTTIDHFAFTIQLEDLEQEQARLESLGIAVDTAVHLWVKWRSLFFSDPEGNRIEFVCYDESIES
ncbi:MAG: VOC family protein [Puniceicoccaceae bacterium]